MNLLKEKLNPNSEYNKKLRRDGIAIVEEMYKEAIECLEDCIKNQPCECRNEMRLAIEALEKQIPRELTDIRKVKEYDGYDMGNCPICGEPLDNSFYENLKYCFVCGQAIKWE